jgi:hypothetical protein
VPFERPAEAAILARFDEEREELECDAPDRRRCGNAGEALHRRVPDRVPVIAVECDYAVRAVGDDEIGEPLTDGAADDGASHTLVQTAASGEERAGPGARKKTEGIIATERVREGVQQAGRRRPGNDREVTYWG